MKHNSLRYTFFAPPQSSRQTIRPSILSQMVRCFWQNAVRRGEHFSLHTVPIVRPFPPAHHSLLPSTFRSTAFLSAHCFSHTSFLSAHYSSRHTISRGRLSLDVKHSSLHTIPRCTIFLSDHCSSLHSFSYFIFFSFYIISCRELFLVHSFFCCSLHVLPRYAELCTTDRSSWHIISRCILFLVTYHSRLHMTESLS